MSTTQTMEIEISPAEAKPTSELWDILSEAERQEFRCLAAEMREAFATAKSPEDARKQMIEILGKPESKLSEKAAHYFNLLKQHAWDDRTWAQRLAVMSLVPTLPFVAGEAAGLAIMGTAFRVSVPVVFAAGATLLGSLIDLAVIKKKTR